MARRAVKPHAPLQPKQVAPHAYIGTSGWSYAHWKDRFYAGVKRKDWLPFAASHFTGIEVNATFYRLQDKETFKRWHAATPADFRFAIKANRFVTHNKKLLDPAPSIKLERERANALREKLVVVLWQLPRTLKKNSERLEHFATALQRWPETRHAIEFRHPSWFDTEIADLLHHYRVAVCQSDASDWPLWDAVTTDLVYVRLHGHTQTYASAYSVAQLSHWAVRINGWLKQDRDVHVYFDNDAEAAAPANAQQLLALLGKHEQRIHNGDSAKQNASGGKY